MLKDKFVKNLLKDKFTHFSADNIDFNDSTLDGKNAFHATEVAAWQRGPSPDVRLNYLFPSKKGTLVVPEAMEKLLPANIVEGKSSPAFSEPIHRLVHRKGERRCCTRGLCHGHGIYCTATRQEYSPCNVRPAADVTALQRRYS